MARTPWDSSWPPGERIPGHGLPARSRRGPFGATWWGRTFVEAVEAAAGPGRIARGRTYARAGQVLRLDVAAGRVDADVQGSRRAPYRVELLVAGWDAAERARLADAVAADPVVVSGVLAGALPEQLGRVCEGAGLSLFPASAAELRCSCTCPDYTDPCKHAAAVVNLLAERLDDDPFLALVLRGSGREALLTAVAARRARGVGIPGAPGAGCGRGAGDAGSTGGGPPAADPPLDAGPADLFWVPAGPLPAPPAAAAALDDLDHDVLGAQARVVVDLARAVAVHLRAHPPRS